MHIDRVASADARAHSVVEILSRSLREDGLLSFFRDPHHHAISSEDMDLSPLRRRLYSASRTLARVGPWGIGFLVWEAFGPGIS